ncbi:MAG: DNA cytosine methyltransferase [Methylibium sp.]|nr:DNA cytosine methyltransferase [Methylibium sp.]
MKFGSVCSGIEAASLAFRPLGWEAAWFSEVEPFPCSALSHHYPAVPNLGDMTTLPERVRAGEVEAPDMLCGGTPCQAFSVAGNRESLADARGNLSLTFCELADAIDDVRAERGDEPAVIFWENVPGSLSTDDNFFGCFLGALAGSGAALVPGNRQRWTDAGVVVGPRRVCAWRVLDAQFFGLAQRRRRVFVVASARDGFDPAEVLLERDGVRRHPATRREAGQDIAVGALRSTQGGSDVDHARAQHLVVGSLCADSHPGSYSGQDAYSGHLVTHALTGEGFDASEDGTGRGTPLVAVAYGGNNTGGGIDVATACNAKGGAGRMDFESETFIVFDPTQITSAANRSNPQPGDPCHTLARGQAAPAVAFSCKDYGNDATTELAPTLRAMGGNQANGGGQMAVKQHGMRVRRLLPVECERLQGMPDGYTDIPHRGKPAADGPRYKAIGNSWAVPCVAWIGRRIAAQIEMTA